LSSDGLHLLRLRLTQHNTQLSQQQALTPPLIAQQGVYHRRVRRVVGRHLGGAGGAARDRHVQVSACVNTRYTPRDIVVVIFKAIGRSVIMLVAPCHPCTILQAQTHARAQRSSSTHCMTPPNTSAPWPVANPATSLLPPHARRADPSAASAHLVADLLLSQALNLRSPDDITVMVAETLGH
jgi:hypothetical protein